MPKVVSIPARMAKTWGKGRLVIPAPREVDALMRKVPKGKLLTINELRVALARQHQATMACPPVSSLGSPPAPRLKTRRRGRNA